MGVSVSEGIQREISRHLIVAMRPIAPAVRAIVLLCTTSAPQIAVRQAQLNDPLDAEALCCVRKPTEYVSEQGSTGFMGQKTELSFEEAQKRRIQARLGSAMRDKAVVLIATDAKSNDAEPLSIVGTVDCVELPAGKGRRAGAPELPRRFLVRNLWVSEECRRQGIARQLMAAVDDLAAEKGISYLSLDVLAANTPALQLYEDLGFEDLEPTPWLPSFLKSALSMGKSLS